ncbi:hypothetical protein V8F06_014354 [Rhypophila decipiens]
MSNPSTFIPQCTGHENTLTSTPDITGVDTIPQNINVVMLGGSNNTLEAMTNCCAPNYVQVLDGCYLWCKIPESGSEPKQLKTADDIRRNISACLDVSGLRKEGRVGIALHIPNTGGRATVAPVLSTTGLGIVGLVMVGVLMG